MKTKSNFWKLIFWVVIILGFITPFIDYFVVILMFYLLIPFAIIIVSSVIIFAINLIKFEKSGLKQNSTILSLIIPIFLLSQIISTYSFDKIISKLEKKQSEYPKNLDFSFGIKYQKINNENSVELEYYRVFFVREIYQSENKKWKSYGWND